MTKQFKKCPNGHYYDASLPSCPYCPKDGSSSVAGGVTGTLDMGAANGGAQGFGAAGGNFSGGSSTKTIDMSAAPFGNGETKPLGGGEFNPFGGGETKTLGGGTTDNVAPGGGNLSGKTMVYDDVFTEDGKVETVIRSRRKIVGWLISYTLDEMGMDFKLFEGRNIIGRNIDCSITISDETVSSNHATILYRDGKFSIKDNQSTKGTFVNEQDIDLDAVRLNDGDIIKLGRTTLKFRSAL